MTTPEEIHFLGRDTKILLMCCWADGLLCPQPLMTGNLVLKFIDLSSDF